MLIKRFLRTLRYFHSLLGFTLTLLIIYIVINTFVVTTFRVDGSSMYPTLENRQLLLINLRSYTFKPPAKDDMVIVAYSGDGKVHFVKRIVATPGDTVFYMGEDIVLQTDEYFVVGDNRDHSTDSRSYGPVKKEHIIGKVIRVF